MYFGPEMKFEAANVVKNRTDMFTVLSLPVMEGQQTKIELQHWKETCAL